MSTGKRLDRLFETAPRILFSNKSKIVLFSDCHRGDGGAADNFAKNQNIYFHALNYYYENGFAYFELGDGEELWENKSLKHYGQLPQYLPAVFAVLQKKTPAPALRQP